MERTLIFCVGLAYASCVSATGLSSDSSTPASWDTSSGLISHYSETERRNILQAHAVLGSLAWVFIIPLGAILFKVLKTPRLFWIHTTVQTLGMCLGIANFGLGVFIAILYKKMLNNSHTIIGVVIFALMLLQPVWGFLQHAYYKKHRVPSWWGIGHRWIGRATIVLAMINGGLGFWLANKSPTYKAENAVAYGVGAGITFVVWVSIIVVVDASNRKKVRRDTESAENASGSVSESGSQSVSKEMVNHVRGN